MVLWPTTGSGSLPRAHGFVSVLASTNNLHRVPVWLLQKHIGAAAECCRLMVLPRQNTLAFLMPHLGKAALQLLDVNGAGLGCIHSRAVSQYMGFANLGYIGFRPAVMHQTDAF